MTIRQRVNQERAEGRREGLREAVAFVTGKAAEANLKGAHIAYDTARYLADELNALASQELDTKHVRLTFGGHLLGPDDTIVMTQDTPRKGLTAQEEEE